MSRCRLTRRSVLAGATAGALGASVPRTSAAGRFTTSRQGGSGAFSMEADPGGYATAESTPSLNIPSDTEVTVEFWINHDGNSDEDAIVLGKNQPDENGYLVSLDGTGEDVRIDFGMVWPNNDNWSLRSNSGIAAGTWTHVACVYDGQRLTIYIDGELDAQWDEWNGESMNGNSAPLRLGTSAAGNERFFGGQLDEVRIWNTARTQIEVTETMYTTLTGNETELLAYYPFDGDTADHANSNDLELNGTAQRTSPGAYPVPPTLYANAGNGAVELTWTPRTGANDENAADAYRLYRGTMDDGSDASQVRELSAGTTTVTDKAANEQLYYYWITAVDETGRESAMSYPAVASPSERASGTGLTFTGSNSYVTVSDRQRLDMPAGDTLSIEFWLNHDGNSDEDAVILSKTRSEQMGYQVSLQGTGAGAKLRFGVVWPNSDNWALTSNNGVPADQWTHVACVYDGNQQAIYIDGELDAKREDWNGETMDGTDAPLLLGATVDRNERFLSGQLDQIRVWNVARTQEQIQEAYNTALFGNEEGLAAYWRTCDGTTLVGSVGHAMTGTMNNVTCTDSAVPMDTSTQPSSGDADSTTQSSDGDKPVDEGTKGTIDSPSTSAASSDDRGFFVNGSAGPLQFVDETILTVVGIVLSIVGIVHQLIGGD